MKVVTKVTMNKAELLAIKDLMGTLKLPLPQSGSLMIKEASLWAKTQLVLGIKDELEYEVTMDTSEAMMLDFISICKELAPLYQLYNAARQVSEGPFTRINDLLKNGLLEKVTVAEGDGDFQETARVVNSTGSSYKGREYDPEMESAHHRAKQRLEEIRENGF